MGVQSDYVADRQCPEEQRRIDWDEINIEGFANSRGLTLFKAACHLNPYLALKNCPESLSSLDLGKRKAAPNTL